MIGMLINSGILTKVKWIVLVVLLTIIASLSLSTYLLYSNNQSLSEKLKEKELALHECSSSLTILNDQRKIVDESMNTFLDEHEKLSDDFSELKRKFNDRKCNRVEHIYLRKEQGDEKITDAVPDDIRAIGLLLDEAACRANRDCPPKPSESPPTPL